MKRMHMLKQSGTTNLRWLLAVLSLLGTGTLSACHGSSGPDYEAMREMNLVTEKVYTTWHPPVTREVHDPSLIVTVAADGNLVKVGLADAEDVGFVDNATGEIHKGDPSSGSKKADELLIQAVKAAAPFPPFGNGLVPHEPLNIVLEVSSTEAWSRGTAEEVLTRLRQLLDLNDNFEPTLVAYHFTDAHPADTNFRYKVRDLFYHRALKIQKTNIYDAQELAKAALYSIDLKFPAGPDFLKKLKAQIETK